MAWRKQKTIILVCLALATLAVAQSLVNLFIGPAVLNAIETSAPLGSLVTTILLFSAALMFTWGASRYFNTATAGRDNLRHIMGFMINERHMRMAYPSTLDQNVLNKLESARAISWSGDSYAIWYTYTHLLASIAGFVFYLTLLTVVDPVILLVVLVTTVPGFFINSYINGWGYRHRDEEANYSRRMEYVHRKAHDISLAKDIRLFNMGPWLKDVYRSALKLYANFHARGQRVYIWGDVVDLTFTFLRNGVAYFFLIRMVINDGLTASQFLLLFAAVGGLAGWMNGIVSNFSSVYRFSLTVSAFREYLEYPEPFLFEDGEPLTPALSKEYELELRDVTFTYPGAEMSTLTNINLVIKPGEKLAIVGLNGAGKTTLVKLLCGFLDPTEGEVLLNGQNIKKYNRRDYYLHFSAVFQEFSILGASVAINIAQTGTDIDMERVIECAKMADLHEKISNLPNGYNTNMGKDVYDDATEFSGGEMQRLMIARALYKNAPVLVLDEPTAALDPIAESNIYNKYNRLTDGRTAVYISHRLASTRFCDRIILLDNQSITEEGTHETLMQQDGQYAKLFEIQSQYYQDQEEARDAK